MTTFMYYELSTDLTKKKTERLKRKTTQYTNKTISHVPDFDKRKRADSVNFKDRRKSQQ